MRSNHVLDYRQLWRERLELEALNLSRRCSWDMAHEYDTAVERLVACQTGSGKVVDRFRSQCLRVSPDFAHDVGAWDFCDTIRAEDASDCCVGDLIVLFEYGFDF
jgi:hypothetical protein